MIVGPIVGLIVLAVFLAIIGYFPRDPIEDAADFLSDLLTAEAKVWLVLVALGIQSIAFALIVVAVRRKRDNPPASKPKVSVWDFCPIEVERYGILWPITTMNDGRRPTGFRVGRPRCPKCHTPLALSIDDDVYPLLGDQWEKVEVDSMIFGCPKDGSQYDLREHKWGMGLLTTFVSDFATGEYEAAQAAARSGK